MRERNLPEKLLLVHRFTADMIENEPALRRYPGVELVVNVDGFGTQAQKKAKYREFTRGRAKELNGFKLFYREDTGLMTPRQTLRMKPAPGRRGLRVTRPALPPVTAPSGDSRPRLSGCSRRWVCGSGCGGWATTCQTGASVSCSTRWGRSTCSHFELPVGSVETTISSYLPGSQASRTAAGASWSPTTPSTFRPAATHALGRGRDSPLGGLSSLSAARRARAPAG